MRPANESRLVVIAPPSLPPEPCLQLVKVMDNIRRVHDTDEEFEFYWFAREYPRIFRHHANHAYHRLELNHGRYLADQAALSKQLASEDEPPCATFSAGIEVTKIYWDFESQLQAIGSALDVLARIAALESKQDAPITFNRLSKFRATPVGTLFEAERIAWVEELKSYRDCFVHYTPVDTLPSVIHWETPKGWRTRCNLPSNPSSKHIVWFKHDYRRRDLLSYGIYVMKRLWAFDRKLARHILETWKAGDYPQRWKNFHRLGS